MWHEVLVLPDGSGAPFRCSRMQMSMPCVSCSRWKRWRCAEVDESWCSRPILVHLHCGPEGQCGALASACRNKASQLYF